MAGDTKEELLMKLKVSDLKLIAIEKKIKVAGRDEGYLGLGILKSGKTSQPTKDDYIDCLLESNKVTKKYIQDLLDKGLTGAYSQRTTPTQKALTISKVTKAIEQEFLLEKSHTKENEFEQEFYHWCNGCFGSKNVTKQIATGSSRIDVQVGDIGIELKLLKSPSQLHTLKGQVEEYLKIYKNKLIVLLVTPKIDASKIQQFKRDMDMKNVVVITKY